MSDTPSPHELARDQVQIEKRLDREYEQLTKRMDEGFSRVDQSLADIKRSIERQTSVPMELFKAEQKRRDEQHRQLSNRVESYRTQGAWALAVLVVLAVAGTVLNIV